MQFFPGLYFRYILAGDRQNIIYSLKDVSFLPSNNPHSDGDENRSSSGEEAVGEGR